MLNFTTTISVPQYRRFLAAIAAAGNPLVQCKDVLVTDMGATVTVSAPTAEALFRVALEAGGPIPAGDGKEAAV